MRDATVSRLEDLLLDRYSSIKFMHNYVLYYVTSRLVYEGRGCVIGLDTNMTEIVIWPVSAWSKQTQISAPYVTCTPVHIQKRHGVN